MAEPTTGLHVQISGDCDGLIKATDRAESRLEDFAGNTYRASVGISGVPEAVGELGKVSAAAGGVPSSIPMAVDAGQVSEARGQLTGLGSDARQAGRDLDSAFGGSRALSFSGGGEIRQLTGDLSRAQESYQSLGQTAEGVMQRADQETKAFTTSQRAMNAEMQVGGRSTAVLSTGLDSVGESAQLGSRTMNAFEQDMASASSQVDKGTRSVQQHTGALQELQQAQSDVGGGGGGLPPIDDGGGGGGGGGRMGGGPKPPDEPTGIMGNGVFKEGGAIDSGISKLGLPAIAGAAIGVVEALAPAALGMMAMNEVVKSTPALAYASGKAMAQLADGIREGSAGATAAGVPAFQALGQALKPLGEEVGHIGAANIGQVLGAETSLARGLTSTLKSLEPTISPAITAVESLGNAFLQGISNPEVAKGITATANALSTPQVAKAVSDITTGLAVGASYIAQGGVQAVTSLTGDGNGATNVGSGWKTQPFGQTVAQNSGGMYKYSPQDDAGIAGDVMPLPGGSNGIHLSQDNEFGRIADAVGSTIHGVGVGARDFANGSMFRGGSFLPSSSSKSPWATQRWDHGDQGGKSELQAANKDMENRWGAVFSGKDESPSTPSGPQGSATPDELAAAQTAAPLGYDRGPGGSLTASTSIGSGGGYYPGAPAGRTPADVPKVDPATGKLPPSPNDPSTSTRAPAPGSSGGMLTPQQVQSLSSSLPQLSSSLSQTGSSAQQLSSGLQQTPQATQHLSQGLQQVGQSAQQMSAPMQQASQHVQQATQSVSQLAAQAPAAVSAVQQVAPAASKALSEAAPIMQAGGSQLGEVATASVASGIIASTPQACDASAKMMSSTQNCAKAVAGISSPSKVFQGFGINLSEGLALGIQNSTPQAVAAVTSAMNQVVTAGQAGLQTASPSKTFQTMGEQAMAQTAAGANSYGQGAAQRQPGALYGDEKAYADSQKQAEDRSKTDQFANENASYQKYLDKMGYDKDTQDKLMQKKKDEEQKDANKPESERQKLNQAALDRTRINQMGAMEKVGIRGLTDDPNNPNSKLSPMGQYKALEKAKSDADKALGLDAVRHGETPDQVLNSRRNATLDAGPDTGGPGQGGFGDPSKGFGKTGVGQNSSGYEQGKGEGKDGAKGFKDGMDGGKGGAADAGGDAGQAAVDAAKRKTGVRSPSTVFYGIGGDLMTGLSNGVAAGGSSVTASIGDVMSGALGSGVTAASNGVMGIASNAGLAVGYQWARSMVSGVDSVLKTADYQQVSLPQVGTALAKTALGQLGLLGPAGSGGSIPNTVPITMSGGSAAVQAPQPIVVNVMLDGQPFDQKIVTQIQSAMNQLADSIPQQVG